MGSLVTKKFIIGDGFAPRGYSPGLGACASNRQDARKSVHDNIRAEDLILVMNRSKCERRVTQGRRTANRCPPALVVSTFIPVEDRGERSPGAIRLKGGHPKLGPRVCLGR